VNIIFFSHSILSDWNHGNAHFLRGVVVELQSRGHRVVVYEPRDSWSASNLVADHGRRMLAATLDIYPTLEVRRYDDASNLEEMIDDADVIVVHEWNPPELVARLGRAQQSRRRHLLLFHDTHHRSVTEPGGMRAYDLSGYDGVLVFGEAIRQRYLAHGWARRVWTWHEAADVRVFGPRPRTPAEGDLVWVGNWGDEERTRELHEFLIEPVRRCRLRSSVYGVRYPESAQRALAGAGIAYRGWVANYEVPCVFASHRVTIHVPRRPYATALPGIPTIRPFEALACGIPLISAPWRDEERLFREGEDYLVARNGREMEGHLRAVIHDADLRSRLVSSGRETILKRHTCAHRVDELLTIVAGLQSQPASADRAAHPGLSVVAAVENVG